MSGGLGNDDSAAEQGDGDVGSALPHLRENHRPGNREVGPEMTHLRKTCSTTDKQKERAPQLSLFACRLSPVAIA